VGHTLLFQWHHLNRRLPVTTYFPFSIVRHCPAFATYQALHQQAADEHGRDELGRAGKEGCGKVLGGSSGYGSGLGVAERERLNAYEE